MPCAQVPRKDVALPWMNDPRWEVDTLFLVFEEDFRFTPGHDVEPLPEDTGEARAAGEPWQCPCRSREPTAASRTKTC